MIYLKGVAMGASDVVPGVSGGTIAFITGIYERLINAIKSIMLIWDLFILDGWKEIMKIGLILLKKKERYLIEKNSEVLLQFLTGDILKSEILDNEHFDELMDICNSIEFKLSNKLLKDFEDEYQIKKTIDYFKDNNINTY